LLDQEPNRGTKPYCGWSLGEMSIVWM